MKQKPLFILLLCGALLSALFFTSPVVAALSVNGSANGGTSGIGTSAGGTYTIAGIHTSGNTAAGYRFSVVDEQGNRATVNNQVMNPIDIYAKEYGFINRNKFETKYTKTEYAKNYTDKDFGSDTTTSTADCYYDEDLGVTLPSTTETMPTWGEESDNINPIIKKISGTSAEAVADDGYRILVEPIYSVQIDGTYYTLTVTEIAFVTGSRFGWTTQPEWVSDGAANSFCFIAKYTNAIFPNSLLFKVPDLGLDAPGTLSTSSVGPWASAKTIITNGYGAMVILSVPGGVGGGEGSGEGTPATYKVTLDNQGATTPGTPAYWYQYNTTKTINNETVYYYTDSALATPLSGYKIKVPAKTGYAFGGYYTGKNGTGTQYVDAGGTCINNMYKTVAADTTLYAQWTPITYTVKYNGNGATDGSTADSTHTYDVAKNLTANGFIRAGYTFVGWNTKADGTGTSYTDEQSVKNLASTSGATVNLYAQWGSHVLFDVNHNDINPNLFVANNITGKSAGLITSTIDEKTGVITLDGTQTANFNFGTHTGLDINEGETFTITLTHKNGSYSEATSGTHPGRFVVEFLATETRQYVNITLPTADNPVVKATLTVNKATAQTADALDFWVWKNGGHVFDDYQFTVKVEKSNSVTSFSPVAKTVIEGSAYGTLPTPSREGYTFLAWNTKSDGNGVTVTSETSFASVTATTLYAQWKPNGGDDFPVINAVDRWFSLDDAQDGAITFDELMKTAEAVDGEVGDVTDFKKGEGTFTIIDYDAEEFGRFTTTGSVTITYQAIDKTGNETYRTVTVHIVDKNKPVGQVTKKTTRFISSSYFKDTEGNFVVESNGGLHPNSIWIKNDEYSELLTEVLGNAKDADTGKWKTVYQTWTFTKEQIAEVKEYVEFNGLGNSKASDALSKFYDLYVTR